jgi:hypothetical protein
LEWSDLPKREVIKMKYTFPILMTAAFVLAFGTASAGELANGVTDFSSRSYDNFEIAPAVNDLSGAKGAHDVSFVTPYNGVTDFRGETHDAFVIGSPEDMNGIEGTVGGGLRMDATDRVLYNGITDFSGRSRDTGEIGL